MTTSEIIYCKASFIISLLILLVILNQNLFCQEYFPLKIGNRWDYCLRCARYDCNGQCSDVSLQIIGTKQFDNWKEYFIISNPLLFYSNYIRTSNDSLFIYDTLNNTDCFKLKFNNCVDSSFYSCTGEKINFTQQQIENVFGQADTVKLYNASINRFAFSKNFGPVLLDHLYDYPMVEHIYNLIGCIISGVRYGTLTSIISNTENNIGIFKLYQNYPDPFNPSTKINYSVSKPGFVTLKVYNVLGKEVETLVNEYKPAGNYEVKFNADNLSNGVYIYTLNTGKYHAARKMILLK